MNAEPRDRLEREGFHTELNLPDADDSLGGVLRVWATTEELLRRNPAAERDQVREVCARYGSEQILEELIGEV